MDSLAKELREKILFDTSREDLLNFCQIDDTSQEICHPDNESFWKRRVRIDYGEMKPNPGQRWSDLWTDLSTGYIFRYQYALESGSTLTGVERTTDFIPNQYDMEIYRIVVPARTNEYLNTAKAFLVNPNIYFGNNEVSIVLHPDPNFAIDENTGKGQWLLFQMADFRSPELYYFYGLGEHLKEGLYYETYRYVGPEITRRAGLYKYYPYTIVNENEAHLAEVDPNQNEDERLEVRFRPTLIVSDFI